MRKKSELSTYDLASAIVKRALPEEDPEKVPEMDRFRLVIGHILGNPVIDGKVVPQGKPLTKKGE